MERKSVTTATFIGASIRRLRMEHGETQQQLGEFLGYGATTIANYESGTRLPNLETFLEIAVHYNAEIRDFIIHSLVEKEQKTLINFQKDERHPI